MATRIDSLVKNYGQDRDLLRMATTEELEELERKLFALRSLRQSDLETVLWSDLPVGGTACRIEGEVEILKRRLVERLHPDDVGTSTTRHAVREVLSRWDDCPPGAVRIFTLYVNGVYTTVEFEHLCRGLGISIPEAHALAREIENHS